MAEVVVFHHVLGLTPGITDLAERLRAAGHTVHVPDLFEGRTFPDLDSGMAHVREVGFDVVRQRGVDAVSGPDRELAADLVYVGFSLGVMPAQQLAQTRPGARGAVLAEAAVAPEEFGGPWPVGVPVQVHGMEQDPFFADGGDLEAGRDLVAALEAVGGDAEIFLYPGDQHLFTDASLPSHRPDAAALFEERLLAFLARV